MKSIILTTTSIFAMLIISLTACGIDTSTPEGTVRAMLKARESHNATAEVEFMAESMLLPNTREEYASVLDNAYGHFESTSITNLQTTVEFQDEYSATVLVSYHIEQVHKVNPVEGGMDMNHVMVLVNYYDDRWLIALITAH